jgi:hypothetical protein
MPVGAAGVSGLPAVRAAAVMCCAASRASSSPADPVVIASLKAPAGSRSAASYARLGRGQEPVSAQDTAYRRSPAHREQTQP